MSEVFIPAKQSKQYSTSQSSDLFGNLVRTRNLDFTKKGYLSLARKPITLYTETETGTFGLPLAILPDWFYGEYLVVTDEGAFGCDFNSFDFSATASTAGSPPTFSLASDGVSFGSEFVVSGTTMVCSLSVGWTSRITGLASYSGYPYRHPLCVSEHQQFIAVGNVNTVKLYNSSYVLQTTCTLPANQIVSWIRWMGNLLYIGTFDVFGGDGKLYIWNGSGTAANAGYGLGAIGTPSGCEYDSSMVVFTSDGRILRFVGGGFVPLKTRDGREVRFPERNTRSQYGLQMANRGSISKDGKIYMVVDASIGLTGGVRADNPDFPSGLYVFDQDIGLYHKAGVDYKQRSSNVISAVSSNEITLTSAEVFETGDPVACKTIGTLTGDITASRIYYAIKTDSTHLKLANTAQQAKDGEAITITGSPSAASILLFNVYNSLGATRFTPGCVASLETVPPNPFMGNDVMWGGSAGKECLMSFGMGRNIGSFITPKIQASQVQDVFKKIIAKFPPLNLATRKILIKYRIENRWGTPGRGSFGGSAGTWASSTTFTINPKQYDFYSVQVGDEIEITYGVGSGYTAHITAISEDSATQWTITIDETLSFVTASDTFDFIVDNWTKYKTISTADDATAAAVGFKKALLAKRAKWVQLKVELRGYTDIEETVDMEEVMLTIGADQKYT